MLLVKILVPALLLQAADEPLPIGPGVTPPRPPEEKEPSYTPEARDAHIQGATTCNQGPGQRGGELPVDG